MSHYNFLFVDQSSPIFSPNVEEVVVDQVNCYPICNMSIHSGDISDQSRKLSEIAPNFGRFFSPSQTSGGGPSKSYSHFITPTSRHVAWKRFCEDTLISPEVLVAHTLNFKSNFKFSRLNFFGGTPVLVLVCASKAWSICNACKNLSRQHPPRAKM